MTSGDDSPPSPTAGDRPAATGLGTERPRRIAVLSGGLSLEREVSLRSGERVAEALAEHGHTVKRLDLDASMVERLLDGDFELAYLALHGRAGEDGTVQGLLDLLDLPYTGPGAVASALAWDKVVCKGTLRRAGIATPPWAALSVEAIRDLGAVRALDRLETHLGSPLMVKPAQGGASMGVRQVSATSDVEELSAALVGAFSYHDVALVERHISGAEVAVSVVAGRPLPPVEIVPRQGTYDYAARYTHGEAGFFAPARLDPATLARCEEAAVAAYEAVGCRHVTRVDFIVDADGCPWVLELDTCPGMTETSLLPLAAQTHGWPFEQLCDVIAGLALGDAVPAAAPSPGAD